MFQFPILICCDNRVTAYSYTHMSSPTPADDMEPPSSQDFPARDEFLNSSPPRPSTYKQNGRKERRDPSVTPRKFRKFFTPRSHGHFPISSARQALHDITAPTLNRNASQSSPLRPFRSLDGSDDSPVEFPRQLKRRKIFHTPESSPDRGPKVRGFRGVHDGPSKEHNLLSSPCQRAAPDMGYIVEEDEDEEEEEELELPREPLKRIARTSERGLTGQMLNMSLGLCSRSRRQHFEYPASGM